MFYLAGSLLFAFALVAALGTIIANFVHYRAQMVAALRTLSLDGLYERERTALAPAPSGLAVMARRDRPVRPAPQLAA